MAARWLVVKVMDEELLAKCYNMLQEVEGGVDCTEVAETQLNQAVIQMFEIDPNASWLQDNSKEKAE